MDLSATLLTPSRTTDPSFISSVTKPQCDWLAVNQSKSTRKSTRASANGEQPILKQQLNYLDLSPSFLCITVLGLDLS